MGVEAIDGSGVNRANVTCDECGRAEVVVCDYERTKRGQWVPNLGQIHRKVVGHGWEVVKGSFHCPKCAAKRRAVAAKPISDPATEVETQEATMTKTEAKPETASVTPIRKPTPKQERLIILALEDAYDDTEKRYRGTSTDKTLADDLGDGVMFGWVAEIRERLFGPSGGNEEIEAIRTEIDKAKRDCEAKIKAASDDLASRTAALSKRLDAVCAAVGPRARSA